MEINFSVGTVLVMLLIGLAAGVLGGSLGVGGGVVIIPALVFILGFTQHEAQGTSLAVLTLPVTLIGVYAYHKAGHVNYKVAAVIIIAYIVGNYLGAKVAMYLSAKTLKQIFSILLMLVALKMWFSK